MEKLTFTTDDGESFDYFVIAETTVKGTQYLLVSEEDEEEAEALILKEVPVGEDSDEAVYESVMDDDELHLAMEAFDKMLEDIDIE